MNQPAESQFTEILIERNAYREFLEGIANDRSDRVLPGVKEDARRLLDGYHHPAHDPQLGESK